jgi:hypothetical protein
MSLVVFGGGRRVFIPGVLYEIEIYGCQLGIHHISLSSFEKIPG